MSRFVIAAALAMCLAAAPAGSAAADDSARATEVAAPAKPQVHKKTRSARKPAPAKSLLGDGQTVASDPLTRTAPPDVNLKTPGKDNPLSVGARWSVSNDPNYGLASPTTQNDILKENFGQTPSATRNKFDLGVDYKF